MLLAPKKNSGYNPPIKDKMEEKKILLNEIII